MASRAIRRSVPKTAARGSLPDLQAAQVRRLLDPLCVLSGRPEVDSQLRYGYRFEGPAVVFFESRVRYDNRNEWFDHDIAKFRFTKTTAQWSLYCQFRDFKWHGYEPMPHSPDLRELVAEVRRDPTGIFFG